MKKLLLISVLLSLVLSCASFPVMQNRSNANARDQIHAENRVMKKNLELALRENEVVKTENAQYKTHVKELDDTISTLNADMKSLTAKYDEDTTRMTEEIARLNESYAILVSNFTQAETKSSQKISELTEQAARLEKQMTDETARLNNVIKDQQTSFDAKMDAAAKELASTRAGCADREAALQDQLSELQQSAVKKDAAIQSLAADRQEALTKAADLGKTIDGQTDKIQRMEKAAQEQMASLQDLKKTILEKQAVIDQLSKKTDPVPVPATPPPSDPQSVK